LQSTNKRSTDFPSPKADCFPGTGQSFNPGQFTYLHHVVKR
jgi:hypothetical protein